MHSVSSTNQPPLAVTVATEQQKGKGEGKRERDKKESLCFSTFNGAIRWLETDWNNKNRAWPGEGGGQNVLPSRFGPEQKVSETLFKTFWSALGGSRNVAIKGGAF